MKRVGDSRFDAQDCFTRRRWDTGPTGRARGGSLRVPNRPRVCAPAWNLAQPRRVDLV